MDLAGVTKHLFSLYVCVCVCMCVCLCVHVQCAHGNVNVTNLMKVLMTKAHFCSNEYDIILL